MRLAASEQLGPYEIVALIGAGGMGEVYRALDPRLGREVAIKILRGVGPIDDERRRRFEREARAIAGLDHPHILTVFDVGTARGTDYLVTELLRGESLRARLDRARPLPWPEAARLAEAVARGLAAAHARGVVHRDVKPENVFLTEDGRVKILDFGLAHVTAGGGSAGDAPTLEQTAPGLLLGTAPYMAPEQVRGEPVSPATDLFALGAVLHECISGTSPFRRDTAAATFAAVLAEPAPTLSGIPDELARLIDRCLAKRGGDRPASAAEVADALATLSTTPDVRAPLPALAPVSIAVLPFADLSPAGDQEYFCDGVAEEILHALSRLSGVRVAARGAAFQFRGGGHDLRTVAQRLDVEHVLDGSVRRSGQRVRISVQLVEASSGRPIWSERYDRDATDVFAIQDEIAATTATTLSILISDEARRAWRRRGTQDLAAYDAYLQGRRHAAGHGRAGSRAAIDAFRRAVDLDPAFAAAWAALADAHALRFTWFGRDTEDVVRADEASARAIALDPDAAEVLAGRGQALAIADRLDDAIAMFERALAAAPALYDALYAYARLRFSHGDAAPAAELFERAARARTDDYQALCLAVMAYEACGEHGRAVDAARRAVARVERRLTIAPDDVRALYLGAGAYVVVGERGRPLEMVRRVGDLEGDDPSSHYNVACVLAKLGEHDEALTALERAVGHGFGARAWIEQDSDLAALRGSPRFTALMDRLP